jgi:glycosyltransferase involved in cell wall biosynthesis
VTTSIVITTHNRAALLPRAVRSAFLAGKDVEVIVVDDASTDETPEVCARLEGIRYIRLERNVGLAEARNVGVRASVSEYIAFLDDDDTLLPGGVSRLIAVLEAEPKAGFAYGRAIFGRCEGETWRGILLPKEVRHGDLYWYFLKRNPLFSNVVVARRQCLLDVGLSDARLRSCEDWHLWIRLAERYPVCSVNEPVATVTAPITAHSGGSMSSNRVAMAWWAIAVQREGLDLPRGLAAPAVKRYWVRTRFESRAFLVLGFRAMQALLRRDFDSATHIVTGSVRLWFDRRKISLDVEPTIPGRSR